MIDSHSHIYTKRFQEDQPEVIERAREQGLTQLLQVGCNLEDSHKVIELAKQTPGIYASVGVHPHDADTWDAEVRSEMEQLIKDPKVVAYGEIGLDFYYDNSPRAVQQQAFSEQLDFAISNDLPLVIHTRDAEPETLKILKEYPHSNSGQVHCFTGSMAFAKQLLDEDYYIGFTGIITFKRSDDLREIVRMMPWDRILIETDSPYLAPTPHRGKRNEPAFVKQVAETVAAVKNTSLEEVIEKTTQKFLQVIR